MKLKLAGHIKVLSGPEVARGPDVAQAWFRGTYPGLFFNVSLKDRYFEWSMGL
jgi:hypothetical protein